jgi:hypothetical protein
MLGKHSATLTALLMVGAASFAHAQQVTGDTTHRDSTHAARVTVREDRAIATDTMRLHRDIAMRDSARTTLNRGQAQTSALGKQIDSLKTVLDRERKASPRDTTAIKRNEAALKQMRRQQDRDLDRDRREKSRVESIEKRVDKESDAAIAAHQKIKAAHQKTPARSSASKTRG